MNASLPDEEALFNAARRIGDGDARMQFLRAAAGGNEALFNRVVALVALSDAPDPLLDRPAADFGATGAFDPTPKGGDAPGAPREGTTIGPYKLLQEIGEGGMGTVWMAEQDRPVRRKVALKVIKPGMDSRQVVARFEAERQALAMMDHVNIARVLDGGATDAGLPYFVMELVRGIPITKYCDDNHLTPRERLELFGPVCQAIQHAHQKGIIHRDIKPSNVMVTLYDGNPVPKVIDFGVAKATEQRLTERTLFTQYGTIVGTLEYMSPEQAEMSALGVDTRSDVYSLGVLLYELLTGNTPLGRKRVKEAGFAEILRMIKEEEPPKPSTRLSDSGETLTAISARRHMEPAKLTRLVRGELDWIVMKTLEKDRNRRYESAGALAADVRRYLADEPVLACPPSAGYRLRKWARRHKGPVLAGSLVALALVGGIVAATWGMIRATAAEATAVNEAAQKTDALTDRETALAETQGELFKALVNRARAERSSGRVGQRFEALKAVRAAALIRVTPELRTEATAALVLPDVDLDWEWEQAPKGALTAKFDASFRRYARLDDRGGALACRIDNGREEIVRRLEGRSDSPIWEVQMSPDGRFVACGYGPANRTDDRLQVWKVDDPEPVPLLDEPPGVYGWSVAFHLGGRFLAVGHSDESVSVYDLITRQRVRRLQVGDNPRHLAFHPREHRLAVATGTAVQLFDTDTGAERPALRHPAVVNYLSWHPDGLRLATGCGDRKIHVWDTRTAAEVMYPISGHTADGLVVEYNPTGDILASADWSGRTRLWDAVGGRPLLAVHGFHPHFSPDNCLFGRDDRNKTGAWRVTGGRELRVLRPRAAGPLDNIVDPVVHPDGRTLAATSRRHLCFFDLASGEELGAMRLGVADSARPAYYDPPAAPQVGPEPKPDGIGNRPGGWVTGGHSGLHLWPARQDPARPEVMRVGPPELLSPDSGGGYSSGASASADGRVVAVPQGHSTLVLDRDRPDRRVELGPHYDAATSAVSPDGRWVVTTSWRTDGVSKTIRVWDAETGQSVRDLSAEMNASAKFSPDGHWLMTRSIGGLRQWEVGAWRDVRQFDRGHAVFSPDSRMLAVSDVFGAIRLVEADTGREVARLTGPEPTWYSPACFTPDGTRLVASCTAETALYVWDLRLIRDQLKRLGLDWEWPDFAPAKPGPVAAAPRRVEVLPGDLGPSKPKPKSKSTLTPEQKVRQAIERERRTVAEEPNNAQACNDLAWLYSTAPAALRDVKAALPLAENAVRLEPKNPMFRNTLGVVYYRSGRYREAAELLRRNLEHQEDWGLACDLYFLAMSHHRLGETARARDSYDLAVRWARGQKVLPEGVFEELSAFRAEAEECLGLKKEK